MRDGQSPEGREETTLRILRASVVAGASGIAAAELYLRIGWGQSLGPDWLSVLLGAAVGLAVLVPLGYWPALGALRALVGGYRPLLLFPAAAALLGLLPLALIVRLRSGGFGALAAPETTFLLVLFSALGAGFGLGYAWDHEAPRGSDRTPSTPPGS